MDLAKCKEKLPTKKQKCHGDWGQRRNIEESLDAFILWNRLFNTFGEINKKGTGRKTFLDRYGQNSQDWTYRDNYFYANIWDTGENSKRSGIWLCSVLKSIKMAGEPNQMFIRCWNT